jgi:hypothetical protein
MAPTASFVALEDAGEPVVILSSRELGRRTT